MLLQNLTIDIEKLKQTVLLSNGVEDVSYLSLVVREAGPESGEESHPCLVCQRGVRVAQLRQ